MALLVFGGLQGMAVHAKESGEKGSTKTVKIGPDEISIIAPQGYCFLDESQPGDLNFINTMKGALARGHLHMVDALADCQELKDWRVGKLLGLNNYGIYMTPMATLARKLPFTRAQFSKMICKAMQAQSGQQSKEILKNAAKIAEQHVDGLKMKGQKMLGVLREDEEACYAGILLTVNNQVERDKFKNMLGLFALTLIKSKTVQLTMYTNYKNGGSITRLLALQRKNIDALLAAQK